MKNRNIKESLFYFSLIALMVMSLNLAIVDCAGMDISIFKLIMITLLISAAISVTIIFPVAFITGLIPAIGWLLYRYYMNPGIISLYLQKSQEFYNWLYWYIAGFNHFEQGYYLAFIILYTTFCALLIALIVYSEKGSFILILIGTVALSFFWFVYVEKARRYLVLYLFASIMLYSYRIYKKRLKEWKSKDSLVESNVGFNWMLCSAIIISTSLVLALALPLKIGPARWPWLNDKVVSMFPFIAEWRNDSLESFSYGFNSRFSLNSNGYINKKLGGELRLDDSVLMTVKTKGTESIYLRGTVKEKYLENGWYKSERGYKEYKSGESMTIPYGSDVKVYERVLEITYKKLLTSTIFAPYSIYQVQHNSKRIYADDDSEVYTSKMTMKEEAYTVTSKLPYVDLTRLRQSGADNLKPGELKAYTEITPDISIRILKLAEEITAECNNNYDKAKAIEKYLRENYKYTRKPPQLPEKTEFVDHFLFDGKEGYCTYFATAMSVLLRASGVPVRYVEGFMARYAGVSTREVKGTNAHAWVEVYFDDYGWLTFEPTPEYPEIELATTPGGEGENESAEAVTSVNSKLNMSKFTRNRRDLEDREESVGGEIYENEKREGLGVGSIILLLVLGVFIIRFAFLFSLLFMKEIKLGRINGRRFALGYLENVIYYMGYAGYKLEQGETLKEFLARVKSDIGEALPEIPTVTVLLERIRYSGYELDIEERGMLETFRKNVKQLAAKNLGITKLFFRLYILGS